MKKNMLKKRKRLVFSVHCSEVKNAIRRNLPTKIILLFFIIIAAGLLVSSQAWAKSCDNWVAKIVSAEGTVEAKRDGEVKWQQVQLDETFCAGDTIRVQDNSRADLAFANQPLLRLDENSAITLAPIEEESTGSLAGLFKEAVKMDLLEGAAHFFSRLPRNLEVRTAFVNAGVEGTEFFIKVAENKAIISVFEGKVVAVNEAGSVGITDGQSAVAEAGKAPVLQVFANPRDAVRWALHYPPVLDGSSQEDAMMKQAAYLLSVGRVDKAGSKIDEALRKDPANVSALALQTVIAVVQNDKDAAFAAAKKAVAAAPESATAQIALSYAQQADFDLEAARASLEKAVTLNSESALAWARLAELQSSFGDLDNALASAQKAVELNPDLSRTQTVLGFAYLTQINTAAARTAFNKAIELDQADSLPHLGLGLAKIRDGELEGGRREIEIAASLDSNSSIIRSYLGKAYYEEKRPELDGREFANAKELDPNDPTPWFYDAIRKQTINQPVAALHDLQKAIELNDNRAVYRSQLLLDADLAARSASLARIYSDLGFQQRALVEGYNSVNTDPTNYSAHRFLSDSYSALPRHEIARVSELLQSQLLQPTNITPIQPQLAESNQLLMNSGGAASASFNEFNPLFNRNQVSLQASGLIGEDSTDGGEAVISGIYKKASFSVGYTKFETDGFRVNNDQDDEITNAFVQFELSPKTSIQAEYRQRESETGDIALRFFENDFYPDSDETSETSTTRLGFRHSFSPNSNLIGNFTYQDLDESIDRRAEYSTTVSYTDAKTDQEAYGGELSYLFRNEKVNFVAGAGYFDIDGEDTALIDRYGKICPPIPSLPCVETPFPLFSIPINETKDAKHTNAYLYSYINLLENVILTLGASGDFYETESASGSDQDQFNPKVGITWNPMPGTTIRAAAFRVFKRTLVTDQTLEPTQVAGFNQFFDDANGTDAWRYGGAIDQKFSDNIYAGIEASKRDLEVPHFVSKIEEADWEEKFFRSYLFWTPNKWLSLSAEYLFEEYERDAEFTANVKELTTHYVPLGINFYHPSGLSLSLKGTYINQEGSFFRLYEQTPGNFTDGEDDFFLVDAAIRYRLPKRHGFVTVGVSNLFDEEFQYFDTDMDNPRITPSSFVYAKLTIAIP